MSLNNKLIIDVHGYWHAGSGRSAGAFADALVQKTPQGLPRVGGRHLKGLLRHALRKAESLGWYRDLELPEGPVENLETLLFGTPSQQESRYNTAPGILMVSDGALPQPESDWLSQDDQSQLRQHLYRRVSSTAMTDRGTALADSLRTIEVTIPMQLHATLSMQPTAVDAAERAQQYAWIDRRDAWNSLLQACALIDSIGANRSRGLGEASLSLASVEGEKQS